MSPFPIFHILESQKMDLHVNLSMLDQLTLFQGYMQRLVDRCGYESAVHTLAFTTYGEYIGEETQDWDLVRPMLHLKLHYEDATDYQILMNMIQQLSDDSQDPEHHWGPVDQPAAYLWGYVNGQRQQVANLFDVCHAIYELTEFTLEEMADYATLGAFKTGLRIVNETDTAEFPEMNEQKPYIIHRFMRAISELESLISQIESLALSREVGIKPKRKQAGL